MQIKWVPVKLWAKIKKIPKQYSIPVAVFVVAAVLYGVIFFIDKPVLFSYANAPCVKQLTLFPDLHRPAGDAVYAAQPSQVVKVGNVAIAARTMCFLPTDQLPKVGVTRVSMAPFGGWLLRKTFVITTNPPPTAQLAVLNKPVPTLKPLDIPFSSTDRVFGYYLRVGGRQTKCAPKDKAVSCDVKKLRLTQGSRYVVKIVRQFADKKVATIATKKIQTLRATRVVSASIKSDETVYSKPRAIDIKLDKPIKKISLKLYRLEGDTRTPIKTTATIDGKNVHLALAKDLPRSATYKIMATSAEAADGSSLEEPYALPFKTSGGPKVVGINIGKVGVPTNATAVVTFDQPLSEKQDINKAITLSGGASVTGKQGNQLLISLANVPKCGDFTIKITDKLQSNYNVAGGSAWSYAARTICHTIGTIGYSSQGRPINAYYFGSGSVTILYTGAIHGTELSTKYLMERWIDDLEANARSIPANKTIVIVPQINPDGVANGTRVNARNVDLNRNFATRDWKKDTTTVTNQPFPGGGGKSPMSEKETQAIGGLVQRLRPALVLSYHSIGGVVVANQTGGSSTWASQYAQQSGYGNATGQSSDTFEYAISGAADDWYAELGVPSIVVELGSHTYSQFDRNQKAMWQMLQL